VILAVIEGSSSNSQMNGLQVLLQRRAEASRMRCEQNPLAANRQKALMATENVRSRKSPLWRLRLQLQGFSENLEIINSRSD
jgi:hypothetical protein